MVALALSASALPLGGCAISDQASDVTGTLTKARYILRLRAIVARVRENSDLPKRLLSVSSPEELTALAREVGAEFGRSPPR